MRKTETIDRDSFDAMLDGLDGDTQQQLIEELEAWADGNSCSEITVTLDSLGRLDSMSSPRPA